MSRPVVVNEVRVDESNVKETRVLTKVRNVSIFHLTILVVLPQTTNSFVLMLDPLCLFVMSCGRSNAR